MSVALNPETHKFEIHTPFGWQSFSGIQKIQKEALLTLSFKETSVKPFKCSPKHPLRVAGGMLLKAEELIEGDVLEHENLTYVTIAEIKLDVGPVILYDILDAGKEKLFYSNGLVSHNCEFIGSSNTLISSEKLNQMTNWHKPIKQMQMRYSTFDGGKEHRMDIHEEPGKGHQYVLTADVAGGKELDSSAFTIIDISDIPYKVVAKYVSNLISPMLFPDVIYQAATLYNSAFVLIETIDNDVAKTLHLDLEYENLITTTAKAKGTQVGGGFSKNVEYGLRSNRATKRIGCSNLKTLIESDKLLTQDYYIFAELRSFVANSRNSYSAEEGKHDDLVMCLVNFGWLVGQKYFKELTDSDVYLQLKKDYDEALEEDYSFFGFVSGVDVYEDDGIKL